MMKFVILLGFAFMFFLLHYTGDIDKYINMKYAYLSISAIVLLTLLGLYDFIRGYRQDLANERKAAAAREALERSEPHEGEGDAQEAYAHADHAHGYARTHDRMHATAHAHVHDDVHQHAADCAHRHDHVHDAEHAHRHDHVRDAAHDHARDPAHRRLQAHSQAGDDHAHHAHGDPFGHTHEPASKFKRVAGYVILLFPIFTGIFLPVKTLDSSFVAAKGFSFPTLEQDIKNNPGFHQFLRPDTSMFYNKDDYDRIKNKEMSEFVGQPVVTLNDDNYLKAMEAIYNYPSAFMGKTIDFNGFAYKGKQVDGNHYFVFRFGFIHCVADSGVFGMLVKFPDNADLKDDDWVRVQGKLTWEFYQPLKATIPVVKAASWSRIDEPKNPYVYRNF
ncbi:TIGR03943 family putative permease subunit [Cohnella thermotolerans]|uniref:TIGR03943 family putative permease subunit n=1 Tax=Cohnella thermotolerans TaxID=329858 RepID=UPI0003F60847|nr:TIGR03943 family protein [Cohnella thermotolerans]